MAHTITLDWADKDCKQCASYRDIKELVPDANIYYVTMFCKKLAMTKLTTNACPHYTQRN